LHITDKQIDKSDQTVSSAHIVTHRCPYGLVVHHIGDHSVIFGEVYKVNGTQMHNVIKAQEKVWFVVRLPCRFFSLLFALLFCMHSKIIKHSHIDCMSLCHMPALTQIPL